jgi:hypothetical protein
MPRYYFHVRRGQVTVLDHDGIELAGAVDAKVQAAERAQQMVNGGSLNGEPLSDASASRRGIIVADDNWQTLLELPF